MNDYFLDKTDQREPLIKDSEIYKLIYWEYDHKLSPNDMQHIFNISEIGQYVCQLPLPNQPTSRTEPSIQESELHTLIYCEYKQLLSHFNQNIY